MPRQLLLCQRDSCEHTGASGIHTCCRVTPTIHHTAETSTTAAVGKGPFNRAFHAAGIDCYTHCLHHLDKACVSPTTAVAHSLHSQGAVTSGPLANGSGTFSIKATAGKAVVTSSLLKVVTLSMLSSIVEKAERAESNKQTDELHG